MSRKLTFFYESSNFLLQSQNLTKSALAVLDHLSPLMLAGKVPGEQPTRIVSETITFEVSKRRSDDISGIIETLNGGHFKLPKNLFGSDNRVVDSKVCMLSWCFLYIYRATFENDSGFSKFIKLSLYEHG